MDEGPLLRYVDSMVTRWLCLAVLLLIHGCSSEEIVDNEAAGQVASVQQGLLRAFDVADEVPVIINFRAAQSMPAERDARRELFRQLREGIVARQLEGFTVARSFMHVPALAARINASALERLKQDPNVEYVQLDGTGSGGLKEAVPAIGADQVKAIYNLTGKGVRVAILDSGVATMHPDLKDSVVAQHCFTQFDCPPSFANEGMSAEDDHGHGTNVTGIVTSNGMVSSPGFAPGAEIVAVKVDDRNDAGQISDWVAGLDWVYDNLAMLHVRVMNLSICSTALYNDATSCDAGEPALARAVKNLVDGGVAIFSAAGNMGSKTQLSAPACNSGVIAVAATYDANVGKQPPNAATFSQQFGSGVANCGDATTAFDQITCFSNTPKRVDLVAPGAPIVSDGLNGQTSTYQGTSQASPAAAGVAALMLECNPKLTPAEIKQAMVKTGVPRTDPKNGNSFPSLRALEAVREACFNGAAGSGGGAGGAAGTAGVAGTGVAGAAVANRPAPGGIGGVAVGAAGLPGMPATAPTNTGAAGVTVGTMTSAIMGAGTGAVPTSTASDIGRGAGAASGCSCGVLGRRRGSGRAEAAWLGVALGMLFVGRRRRPRAPAARTSR